MKPLMVDLFCGLGGWAEGGLAEGFRVIGFDIERHEYGEHRYPAQLVIHIPLVVENVRGAQPWVGRARWNFGSFYLWGDVPALMPIRFNGFKSSGMNWSNRKLKGQDFTRLAGRQAVEGVKGVPHRTAGHWTNPAEHDGTKMGGTWWHDTTNNIVRRADSKSSARKRASALIAKIPLPLSRHIAAVYRP